MKNNIFLLLIFSFNTFFANDILILSGKKINFFLNTKKGCFYIENPYPKDIRTKYLTFKDNPPTSTIFFYIDNKPFKISESELKIEESFNLYKNYIKGGFSYKNLKIDLYFILTNFGKKSFDDSLIILFSIHNNETNSKNIEVRFLFDTVLGEEKKYPLLYTLGGKKIESDKIFDEGIIPEAIFSGYADSLELEFLEGIYIYPTINNYSPKRLIIGNWKKLYLMRNNFIPEPKARFRYNPYSQADAAVFCIYKFKLNAGEKFNAGSVLSLSYIPKENLKFSIEDFEKGPIVSLKKEDEKIEDTLKNLTPSSTISSMNNITVSDRQVNSNEINLLNEKLLLYQKLNNLIDKIENKFLSTNQQQSQQKKEETIKPFTTNTVQIFITNNENINTPAQLETLKNEILKLQDFYEKRIIELQNYYEEKLKEKDLIQQKNEKQQSSKEKKQSSNIDKKIKEIDKNIILLEKLMKINLKSLPQDQLKKIEKDIIELEKDF